MSGRERSKFANGYGVDLSPCGSNLLGAFSHSARTAPVITVFTPVTALKTCHPSSHSRTSFQSSELTELSPPFKVFMVAASCLPASRDRFVVLGARGFARGDGVADFDGLLLRSSGGGEGLRVEGGGESALGMAKEIDSTLHCRFTTFTASRKYSKWSKPSGANPTTVAGTRIPLERV